MFVVAAELMGIRGPYLLLDGQQMGRADPSWWR
jgi:hypothetical protein